MAFVDPSQDPSAQDDNKSQVDQALQGTQTQAQNQQADQVQTPPTTGAGGAGVVSSGTGASASGSSGASSGAAPSKSGSWTNLNSYLEANADQGAGLGQTIAGSVDKLGNQAQGDIDSLGSGFGQAVQGATVNQDQNAVQGAIDSASNLKAGQNLDDNTLNAFNAQKNATYGGPTDVTAFNGYGNAVKSTNDAMTAANQTTSEAGRNTLLQGQFKNSSENGYTQGENNLDQLLLENSAGGKAALQPLAQKWGNLNNVLGNTVTTGNAAAQAGQTTTAATAKAAADAATKAQSGYESNLTTQEQQQLAARNALIAQYQAQTTNSNFLTPEQMASGGLKEGTQVYNTNLKNYINGTTPTVGGYANLDQYAQDAALSKLAGANGILTDPSQASTANFGIFDKSLQPALTDAAAQYQKNLATPGTQIAPMKMPDGSTQDINHFFGDTGGNGVSVISIPLQNLAKQLGGSPQGASINDLQNKWLPALQQLDAQQGGAAGNRGYKTLNEYMIEAIQKTISDFNIQQGVATKISQPLAPGGGVAHIRGPMVGA